jgi:hypothetical protein
LRIGVVAGDDVLEVIRSAADDSFSSTEQRNLDTGVPISNVLDRLVTANAYLGADPIVEALAQDADIIITGRVADPSLTVAPAMHHFGWSDDALDQLAGATVAGHLIECGTQVTGGISTDWLDVPNAGHIGFPIAELFEDGSCIVTKPRGTGGRVTAMTVKEQLVYEIGDPNNYFSPDVAVSFLSLVVEDLGDDRVRVSGAKGKPRPEAYKVSATYRDGFRAAGTLTVIGRSAAEKARRCGEMILGRVLDAGFELRNSVVECLGSGDGAAGIVPLESDAADLFSEVVLRVAVETDTREAAERFSRELMPFITAGPQGITGYSEGRPRVHPVFRYWPCLIPRAAVSPRVEMLQTVEGTRATESVVHKYTRIPPSPSSRKVESPARRSASREQPHRLSDIAYARSGDKGTSANVGVIARRDEDWPLLQTWLTAERVAEFLAPLGIESVERFELPSLHAINFVLHGALRQSLRTDAQGKALGQILLELSL